MNNKVKACFTPHAMMHSLFGFGLGLLVSAVVVGHHAILLWVGLVLIVVAVVLDAMRKA